jgi:hypothetical protein
VEARRDTLVHWNGESMRPLRVSIAATCLISLTMAGAVYAWAQTRKAGLWEMTSNMTWQQSPMPGGGAPPGTAGPQTRQVCLTQAMIDKFGAPLGQTREGCEITNLQKTDHGMSAEMVCSGRMTGKGTIESAWDDPEHAKGKVHFIGSLQAGPNPRPVEWTIESSSVFKGDDCGSVKPIEPNVK